MGSNSAFRALITSWCLLALSCIMTSQLPNVSSLYMFLCMHIVLPIALWQENGIFCKQTNVICVHWWASKFPDFHSQGNQTFFFTYVEALLSIILLFFFTWILMIYLHWLFISCVYSSWIFHGSEIVFFVKFHKSHNGILSVFLFTLLQLSGDDGDDNFPFDKKENKGNCLVFDEKVNCNWRS